MTVGGYCVVNRGFQNSKHRERNLEKDVQETTGNKEVRRESLGPFNAPAARFVQRLKQVLEKEISETQ
jgi:hypothetical protein